MKKYLHNKETEWNHMLMIDTFLDTLFEKIANRNIDDGIFMDTLCGFITSKLGVSLSDSSQKDVAAYIHELYIHFDPGDAALIADYKKTFAEIEDSGDMTNKALLIHFDKKGYLEKIFYTIVGDEAMKGVLEQEKHKNFKHIFEKDINDMLQ